MSEEATHLLGLSVDPLSCVYSANHALWPVPLPGGTATVVATIPCQELSGEDGGALHESVHATPRRIGSGSVRTESVQMI